MNRRDGNEDNLLTVKLVSKLLPKILEARGEVGGRVPVSEQPILLQRDVLVGYFEGQLVQPSMTVGIFCIYFITFHGAHIFLWFKK